MSWRRLLAAVGIGSLLGWLSEVSWSQRSVEGSFRVAPPAARVAPGETVLLRAAPPIGNSPSGLPEHFKVLWNIVSGPGSLGPAPSAMWTQRAIPEDVQLYRAPYVVRPPGAEAKVVLLRGFKPHVDSAFAVVDVEAGVFGGADSCLGVGQTWSRTGRDPEGSGRPVDLPEALVRVAPECPPQARARGLAAAFVVNVLVCRSGRVLDAYPSWPRDATPEASLEEAALEAARQWIFKPAVAGGNPIAIWIAIPFRFPPG